MKLGVLGVDDNASFVFMTLFGVDERHIHVLHYVKIDENGGIYVLYYVEIDENGGIYLFFIMSKPFARMKGTFCTSAGPIHTFCKNERNLLHIRWADAPFLYVPVILVR